MTAEDFVEMLATMTDDQLAAVGLFRSAAWQPGVKATWRQEPIPLALVPSGEADLPAEWKRAVGPWVRK